MNLTGVSTLETAVFKGAAYLDSRYPAWRWRVEPDLIETGCPVHSVVGQLFGEHVANQLMGVGLPEFMSVPSEAESARISQAFCEMGFTVMTSLPYFPSDAMRSLAAEEGVELPEVISIDRDRDVCVMELAQLDLLWEREINKR